MQRTLDIQLSSLDTLTFEAIGLFCWSDVKPLMGVAATIDWRICGLLSKTLQNKFFSGESAELLMLPVEGRFGLKRLFLFGLGSIKGWNNVRCRAAIKHAAKVMHKAGVKEIIFAAPMMSDDSKIENQFVETAKHELTNDLRCILVDHH